MEAMSSEVGHLGEDNDTMGTNIIEPRAQPVLHGEEHQPVLGEDDHQPVLVQEEHQLVAEEQHEPDEDQPKKVSVAKKKKKTWQEAAAAAGVVTMVRDDEVVFNSTKKKTPLQYRMQKPQIKESAKPLNMAEKKLFKEAFNTDKSRLYKRHPKYGKKRNFIIIVEDSVLGKGAQTNGKLMAYACGSLKQRFLKDGIRFDPKEFYLHENHTDFKMEEPPVQKKKRKHVEDDKSEKNNKGLNGREQKAKKLKPKKVLTPGTVPDEISDSSSSSDVESEVENI